MGQRLDKTPKGVHNGYVPYGERMKVWVGDPCYVLTDDQMDQVRDRFGDPEVDVDESFTCIVDDTWNGDGTFYDQNGKDYIVDSGMLCMIPECCIHHDKDRPWLVDCGQVYDDSDWTNFFWDHSYDDGTITFGDVTIRTGPDPEDDEED